MIKLEKYEYRRCFDKWKLLETDKKDTIAMFDWYEMYPTIFAITSLDVRLYQRKKFFRSDCKKEIIRRYQKEDEDLWNDIKVSEREIEDGFILECHFKDKLYKRVKLLHNNKVDFTYDQAIYVNGENDSYIENLYEAHMECMEAISGINPKQILTA